MPTRRPSLLVVVILLMGLSLLLWNMPAATKTAVLPGAPPPYEIEVDLPVVGVRQRDEGGGGGEGGEEKEPSESSEIPPEAPQAPPPNTAPGRPAAPTADAPASPASSSSSSMPAPSAWIRRGVERYDGYAIVREPLRVGGSGGGGDVDRDSGRDSGSGSGSDRGWTISLWFRTIEGGVVLSSPRLCLYVDPRGTGFLSVGGEGDPAGRFPRGFGGKNGDLRWHSVSIVYLRRRHAGEGGEVRLYLDGERAFAETVGAGVLRGPGELRVGGVKGATSCKGVDTFRAFYQGHRCKGFFAGEIGEVSYWDSPRDESELRDLHDGYQHGRFNSSLRLHGFSTVMPEDHDHWAESSSTLPLSLYRPDQDVCDTWDGNDIAMGVYLIGHLRSFPGVNSISPILRGMGKGWRSVVSIAAAQHVQVIPKAAGREYDTRVSEKDLQTALEAMTAPAKITLQHWTASQGFRGRHCQMAIAAQVISERHRENHYQKYYRDMPRLPESDKEKYYILRLYSSKFVLLENAHKRALREYRELTGGSEMPQDALIVVTRPDVHVESDQLSTRFLKTIRQSLKENPMRIFTEYPKMWLSNDQFFITSKKVLDHFLRLNFTCLMEHTFLSSSSLFGVGFTRNLTRPDLKWGRDWLYAETALLMIFELIVGTYEVYITEGGFTPMEIKRNCPSYHSLSGDHIREFPQSWMPGNGDGTDEFGTRDGETINSLNWTHVALAKRACGNSSPSCPAPFQKGRYPFIGKKIMRMYLQNRNDTFTDWQQERRFLLRECKRDA